MKLIQESGENENINNVSEACLKVIKQCRTCAEIKPRWKKPADLHVIHATESWQRVSVDFMVGKPIGPECYSNILTLVDEYSRFLFAFPTNDRSSSTVKTCLNSLFQIFGPPNSDRG